MKCAFRVKVELVVKVPPCRRDGSRIIEHSKTPSDLSEATARSESTYDSVVTVLTFSAVALDHQLACLEAGEGHVDDGVLLAVSILSGQETGERNDREAR